MELATQFRFSLDVERKDGPTETIGISKITWAGLDLLLYCGLDFGNRCLADRLSNRSRLTLQVYSKKPKVCKLWEVTCSDVINHGFDVLDASSTGYVLDKVRLVKAHLVYYTNDQHGNWNTHSFDDYKVDASPSSICCHICGTTTSDHADVCSAIGNPSDWVV